MINNPYESPHSASKPPEGKKRLRTLVELLVVIGVIGILVALLLPARRSAREAARRMSCGNNLKEIGQALHSYYDTNGAFPPAYTVDANGKPLHSWRTLILPFLDGQRQLYNKIDLSKPWNDPANSEVYEAELAVFSCPSADLPPNQTVYLGLLSPGSFFQPTKPRIISEITDDTSKTLMVIEAGSNHAVHWMAPQDATEQIALDFAAETELSHPGGTQALLADGSVRFLVSTMDPAKLRALITIDGNDNITDEPSEVESE